jgi:hypothetical protein
MGGLYLTDVTFFIIYEHLLTEQINFLQPLGKLDVILDRCFLRFNSENSFCCRVNKETNTFLCKR